MKKVISFVLAVMLLASMVPTVFAANATPNTTTLTTTVPDAEYTLNIPADQEITFGEPSTEIGNVTITNAKNFAVGKNVEVTVTYDAFKADAVSTTIPFTLGFTTSFGGTPTTKNSGSAFVFEGKDDNTVNEHANSSSIGSNTNLVNALYVQVTSSDWGKALAGDYTATITFTAAVVVEE